MTNKIYDMEFDTASSGRPWMVFPKVFTDSRGSFSEVLVEESLDGIKQVNRSTSCQLTVRGCHAQRAPKCQSKLVEALTVPIYDIITDARPDSKSFGLSEVYYLNPTRQNKLYVPHGFLHAFAVPKSVDSSQDATFMYYCDNTYSKEHEVGVNPLDILPQLAKTKLQNGIDEQSWIYDFANMFEDIGHLVLSEKDTKGTSYVDFMETVQQEYQQSRKLWYQNQFV